MFKLDESKRRRWKEKIDTLARQGKFTHKKVHDDIDKKATQLTQIKAFAFLGKSFPLQPEEEEDFLI